MGVDIEVDPKLTEAFHLLWGAYPYPASLVHKSRTIIAVNEPCRQGGRVPGMNCAKWDKPETHQGCLANRALREQKAFYKERRSAAGVSLIYWLPIPDYPDFYLHFGNKEIACP